MSILESGIVEIAHWDFDKMLRAARAVPNFLNMTTSVGYSNWSLSSDYGLPNVIRNPSMFLPKSLEYEGAALDMTFFSYYVDTMSQDSRGIYPTIEPRFVLKRKSVPSVFGDSLLLHTSLQENLERIGRALYLRLSDEANELIFPILEYAKGVYLADFGSSGLLVPREG